MIWMNGPGATLKATKTIDPTEEMLLKGIKISDLTNEELIGLKNNSYVPAGVYNLIIEEYTQRLRDDK